MEYRRLGRSGLKVSALSLGSWVTFGSQIDYDNATECMHAAYDAGVNFFDNAEGYAAGESERVMGKILNESGWARHSYVVSTKFFWGLHEGPNTKGTLNRKYLMQAIDSSLDRMGHDFVDLVFCHRPDPNTPIEETVWAMNDMVESGKALYWGTSEWSADEIRAAYQIADRHHLRKPTMEQPEYSLLNRTKVEKEFKPLFEEYGLGTTTWSPLRFGVLTGKYLDGKIPDGSRGQAVEWLQTALLDPAANEKVRKLIPIAAKIGCSLPQMSIAWCARNPNVSTVITGASRVSQVRENLASLDVLPLLTEEILAEIDAATA